MLAGALPWPDRHAALGRKTCGQPDERSEWKNKLLQTCPGSLTQSVPVWHEATTTCDEAMAIWCEWIAIWHERMVDCHKATDWHEIMRVGQSGCRPATHVHTLHKVVSMSSMLVCHAQRIVHCCGWSATPVQYKAVNSLLTHASSLYSGRQRQAAAATHDSCIQCSTAQRNTAQHGTHTQHSMAQHSAAWRKMSCLEHHSLETASLQLSLMRR